MADQDKPRSASEKRPNNKPVYINVNCSECGTPLVLVDILENHPAQSDEIWHDEFICPKCRDVLYLDVPTREF